MSQRVHTNTAYMPNRRLPQIWGAGSAFDAISDQDPNTLHGNRPRLSDALGMGGRDAIISFFHDFTASDPDYTLWFWSQILNDFDEEQGWIKANEDVIGNTKAVPAYCLCSFTLPETCAFFIQGSETGIRNFYLGGAMKHESNPNRDMSSRASNTV